MKHPFALPLFGLLLALFFGAASAQTPVPFWHSMGAVEETVDALAAAFNASQDNYRIEPRYVGPYPEAQTKLLAAAEPPVLFQAELGFFPRLVEEGVLLPLGDLTAALPEAFVADFYPGLWAYGVLNGERYGLPWNASTPVLFYNATAFAQRGVAPPTTWEEFEEAADRLTTRATVGLVALAEAWTFEAMVTTRGGSLVTEDGAPTFDSPEAVEALTLLTRLVDEREALPRTLAEANFALLDFVRTKGMMVFASPANLPEATRFSVAFDIGAAPVPVGVSPAVPLGGAQLVILEGASEAQRVGAFAFWEFLMEPENLQTWVEASYYLPTRRSALPLLEPWYEEDTNRRAALSQLETAVPRPRVAAFSTWSGFLEEALERALKGQATPEEALAEAQRRAEAAR